MKVKPLQIGNKIARLPLIQGGMGVGVSLSRLAGAVAKAGGVGIISTAQIGFEEPDFAEDSKTANLRAMRQELEKARTIARDVDGKCPGLVGFNIMVATRDYEDYVRTAADAGADVIISGADRDFLWICLHMWKAPIQRSRPSSPLRKLPALF